MVIFDQYPGINSREFKHFLDKENCSLILIAVYAGTTVVHECTRRYIETEPTIIAFSPKYLLEGTKVDILLE